ncbi:MAG: oxygenase MpaB family protein [Actinobacteria bacterium]|nr:oxygenase MpaB family protein [Actinomycetota bacterium]
MTTVAWRPATEFDIRQHVSGLGANLAGMANIIMQLGWPQVGYGVKDSTVLDGSAMHHPVKRARTTFTFLAVALLGTDEDQQVFRRAVNKQHAQVRSGADSAVQYSAMDPHLQLWVAACLYYGTADLLERMGRAPQGADADALYAHCARFGTSLQVRPEMWPRDRAAFAEYWEQSLQAVSIDEPMRAYLTSLMRHENLPAPATRLLGEFNTFVTTGFLPPLFRDAMGLEWDDGRQQRFDRLMRRIGRVEQRLPASVRVLPFTLLLRDMHKRQRQGRPLV